MKRSLDRRTLGTVIVASVLAVGFTAIVAGTANARSTGVGEPVINEDGTWYPEDQIDAVWRDVTDRWPSPLPVGVEFSDTAPAFFHPEDGEDHLFQAPLPELIAARYWRCAWIDSALRGDQAALETLLSYAALPGVREVVNVDEYERDMATIAGHLKVDPLQAEFDVECDLYSGPGKGQD